MSLALDGTKFNTLLSKATTAFEPGKVRVCVEGGAASLFSAIWVTFCRRHLLSLPQRGAMQLKLGFSGCPSSLHLQAPCYDLC